LSGSIAISCNRMLFSARMTLCTWLPIVTIPTHQLLFWVGRPMRLRNHLVSVLNGVSAVAEWSSLLLPNTLPHNERYPISFPHPKVFRSCSSRAMRLWCQTDCWTHRSPPPAHFSCISFYTASLYLPQVVDQLRSSPLAILTERNDDVCSLLCFAVMAVEVMSK